MRTMGKTIGAVLLCAALGAAAVCAGCGADEASEDEILAPDLEGIELEAVVSEIELDDELFAIYYDFEYDGEEIDWQNYFTVDDEDDYDDPIVYADDLVDVTYEDGTEASIGDIEEGDEITVVQDENGIAVSIVIND